MQSEVNQEENLNRIITVPNLLSFFRLCLIPVIIWSYCVKKNPLLAGEILLLSGLTDLADGYIARRFHRISNLGKILDPVADKLTQAAMLICLFTRFPHVLLLIVIMAGKFKDGTIVKDRKYEDFIHGAIGKPGIPQLRRTLKNERLWTEKIMRNGMKAKIVRYGSANDIDIKFSNGTIVMHKTYANFCSGSVACK